MAEEKGSEARGALSERWALVLPALSTLLVVWYSLHLWTGISPLGDDASSHTTTIATLARRLADGDGWWSTDYNLGFPMLLYYQPLPHLLGALVTLVLGGPEQAALAYRLLITFAVGAQPWAVYVGLRRAGVPRLHAACAGTMSPLVMNSLLYGYTTFASLKVGLYTQAWGNLALPLVVGELVAMIRGRGSWLAAVAACAFTATSHMFYAIVLVPPIALLAVLLPLQSGEGTWGTRLRDVLAAVGRLSVVGLGAFGVLAAWLVALARTQSYFGGWPFSTNQKPDGYGWGVALGHLRDMTLLDGDTWWKFHVAPLFTGLDVEGSSSAIPVLSMLALVGFALVAFRAARSAPALVLVVFSVTSFLGVVGREGVGEVFDLYPLHRSVQLFRYGAVLQFAAVCTAGWALAELLQLSERRVHRLAPVVVAVVVLASPVSRGAGQLATGFRTIEDDSHFFRDEYLELVGWLRDLPKDGRMLVGPKTEVRRHFHGGLLAYMSQRPAGQSYGVGLHDSLHFYTLEFFSLQAPNALVLADLYDFRYVVSKPGHRMRGLDEHRELLHENEHYELSSLPVSGHVVTLMREVDRIAGTPRGVRTEIRQWLNGNGPELHNTFVLDVTDDRDREGLTSSPVRVNSRRDFTNATPPRGEVLHSAASGSRVEARVRLDEEALVVLKVGYHPFWTIEVDGEPAERLFAFPGYPAVAVGPGEHEVRAHFRWPLSSRTLAWLAPLWLVAAGAADWRRRRKAR
jgi:hypothetical protein